MEDIDELSCICDWNDEGDRIDCTCKAFEMDGVEKVKRGELSIDKIVIEPDLEVV